MRLTHKLIAATLTAVCIVALAGCSPKVGSDAWCKSMKEKPKGDWTANEAADFTKYCLLDMNDKK